MRRTIILVSFLFLICIIILSVLLVNKKQELRTRASGTNCNNTGVTKNPAGGYTFAQLHVNSQGNIVDPNNCVIHLLGLNQGWYASGGPGYDNPNALTSWHQNLPYNITRININSNWWNNNVALPAANNDPIQKVYQQAITDAENAGEYVEIDIGPQFPNPPCGGNSTNPCSSQDQANKNYAADPACTSNPTGCPEVQQLVSYPPPGEQALTSLAKLYSNDPAIIFDVWNEPGDGTFSTFLPDNQYFPAMQKRINIVNTNAPNALVVVFNHSFSSVINGSYTFTGTNIVIDHHSYNPNITQAALLPEIQFAQQKGWGSIVNEYGGTMNTQNEQNVMTSLANNYNVGLLYFSPDNLVSSHNKLPVVLNTLGGWVQQSYSSIFATLPSGNPSITPTPTSPCPTIPISNTPTPPISPSPTTTNFCGQTCNTSADCDQSGVSCGICDQSQFICVSASSPTQPVSNTPEPSISTTPQPSTTPSAGTLGTLSVHFEGIDPQNTILPNHLQRNVILSFYPDQNFTKDPVQTVTTVVTFSQSDPNGSFINNTIDLSSIPNGTYYVLAKSPEGSLQELLTQNPITITANQTVSLNGTTTNTNPTNLRMGDLDNNNIVDLQDYNVIIDCYDTKSTSNSCKNHHLSDSLKGLFADINDDGFVDGLDYNLLIRNFNQQGYGSTQSAMIAQVQQQTSHPLTNLADHFSTKPCQATQTPTPFPSPTSTPNPTPTIVQSPTPTPSGGNIHLIKHVIIIMQENRSFDTYFGTYPGAEGFPSNYCVPNPTTGHCVKPFHLTADLNQGGPHMAQNAATDIDNGNMDGFIKSVCPASAGCSTDTMDVMGYKDRNEIPNYWSYADNFVLQDHMFQSLHTWSHPTHMSLVSGWAASCTSSDPMSCTSNLDLHNVYTNHAWTDITYLLHKNNVSWNYYLDSSAVPQIWNPLPGFNDVVSDGQQGNVTDLSNFYTALNNNTLPSVSWIAPASKDSEHPPALSSTGQAYVTNIVNSIMKSSSWNSSAIFLTWDDWGGFFDHVAPPQVDQNGYGIRNPGLLISAYAKKGFIDKQTLSFDAYLKFIEDDFLNSSRLDPKTDGRQDSRPDVRENVSQLGDLTSEFDFTQPPRPPLILALNPQVNQLQSVAGTQTHVETLWHKLQVMFYNLMH